MNAQETTELRDFHRFLDQMLSNGAEMSPEEALDEWRLSHPDPEAIAEDVAAIQEAFDDIAKGDKGLSFDEFDRKFRNEHNLPAKQERIPRHLRPRDCDR